jgi:hypothetical protein
MAAMTSSTTAADQRSGAATGAITPATAAPPATAIAAKMPSAVAAPRPAAAPTRSEVRALSPAMSTPMAPIGSATP